jgi:hypothetical protein
MTLFTVLVAAIARKVKAVVAEYHKLVAEAKAVEEKLVASAEAEAKQIALKAEAEEKDLLAKARAIVLKAELEGGAVIRTVETQTKNLKNDLINKIAKL